LLSGAAAAAFREVFGFHSVERHLLADPIDRVATLLVFERFDLLVERFPLCKQRTVPGIRHFAHNFSYDGNVDSTKVGHGHSWLKTTLLQPGPCEFRVQYRPSPRAAT